MTFLPRTMVAVIVRTYPEIARNGDQGASGQLAIAHTPHTFKGRVWMHGMLPVWRDAISPAAAPASPG